MNRKTGKFVLDGILIGVGLILSYVESLLPFSFGIPGLKLGLPNLVIVFALFRVGSPDALLVSLIRVLLVALLFGNYYSFCYSFLGACFSFGMMLLLKKWNRFHIATISIAGAVFHHIGQILAAILIFGVGQIVYYLPGLMAMGILTGFLIGILAAVLVKRVPKKVI